MDNIEILNEFFSNCHEPKTPKIRSRLISLLYQYQQIVWLQRNDNGVVELAYLKKELGQIIQNEYSIKLSSFERKLKEDLGLKVVQTTHGRRNIKLFHTPSGPSSNNDSGYMDTSCESDNFQDSHSGNNSPREVSPERSISPNGSYDLNTLVNPMMNMSMGSPRNINLLPNNISPHTSPRNIMLPNNNNNTSPRNIIPNNMNNMNNMNNVQIPNNNTSPRNVMQQNNISPRNNNFQNSPPRNVVIQNTSPRNMVQQQQNNISPRSTLLFENPNSNRFGMSHNTSQPIQFNFNETCSYQSIQQNPNNGFSNNNINNNSNNNGNNNNNRNLTFNEYEAALMLTNMKTSF